MLSKSVAHIFIVIFALLLLGNCSDNSEAPTGNGDPPITEKDPRDPGAPDSVIIDVATAFIDQDSAIVSILVINDEELVVGTIPIRWSGDYWDYDSARFISDRWTPGGSTAVPELIGFNSTHADDSSKMMIWFNSVYHYAPPGRDTIATLYFRKNPNLVARAEPLELEFTTHPPSNELMFITDPTNATNFRPIGIVTGPSD